uniref:Uncharacterized protein n=1 Tax=Nothoprocta perdicaria TaxID=30464 RepID=A0A8C6YTU0_NOTPE
ICVCVYIYLPHRYIYVSVCVCVCIYIWGHTHTHRVTIQVIQHNLLTRAHGVRFSTPCKTLALYLILEILCIFTLYYQN